VEHSITETASGEISPEVIVEFDCAICGRTAVTSFGGLAYSHPTVKAFHRRRGVSLRDRPYWEIPQYVAGGHVEVVSRDPWLVKVSFYADGDACHVEFDGSVDVTAVEIVPEAAAGTA